MTAHFSIGHILKTEPFPTRTFVFSFFSSADEKKNITFAPNIIIKNLKVAAPPPHQPAYHNS